MGSENAGKLRSIVILISGRGSNMQAIVEAALPVRVAAVISNRANAEGLSWAAQRGLITQSIEHRDFASREKFDEALADAIDSHQPDLVVLAGFMRILGESFIRRFDGRLMNIHPSLLPAFPGLHTHRRAISEGVKIHGATVHFVTAALDHGPIVIQAAVPVRTDDDEDTIAARVLVQEHRIYPRAVRWFVEGRLRVRDGIVQLAEDHSTAAGDAQLVVAE